MSTNESTLRFPSVLEAYGATLNDTTFSEDAFLDAVLELLWNASETTSSSAFCAVYILSKHPEVVKKIQNELLENDISSGFTEPLNYKQLYSLKYVELVVKELLRLLPPVGGAYREVIEEFSVGVSIFIHTLLSVKFYYLLFIFITNGEMYEIMPDRSRDRKQPICICIFKLRKDDSYDKTSLYIKRIEFSFVLFIRNI